MLDNIIPLHYDLNTAGGNDGNYRDEVFMYNSEDDEWTTVGQMSMRRSDHGMSLVPGNITNFCV